MLSGRQSLFAFIRSPAFREHVARQYPPQIGPLVIARQYLFPAAGAYSPEAAVGYLGEGASAAALRARAVAEWQAQRTFLRM